VKKHEAQAIMMMFPTTFCGGSYPCAQPDAARIPGVVCRAHSQVGNWLSGCEPP